MKLSKILSIVFVTIAIISVVIVVFGKKYFNRENNSKMLINIVNKQSNIYLEGLNYATVEADKKNATVYDGLTMDELAEKLDRYLADDLKGKGYLYASYSLEIGIDPYLAVAISMHETGCRWGCSTLVKQCNNVGGQVASPRCNGGIYKAYDTLDEGIIGFLNNIKYNYYDYGLTTPEEMNPKYAADPNWASVVNKHINQIKAI